MTPHMESFRVRVFQTDPGGRLTLPALCDFLQEAAGNHAGLLHASAPQMHDHGLAWVLARLYVRLERLPRWGRTLRVTTWPHARDRHSTRRDFLLQDGEGRELGRAATSWVTLDLASRRLVPLPEFLDGLWDASVPGALDYPARSVPRLSGSGQGATPILVRRADLDVNGHVNNSRYPEWALESLPAQVLERRLLAADVSFRAECFAGETVVSESAPGEGGFLHAIRRSDGTEAARMRTWWEDGAWPPGARTGR